MSSLNYGHPEIYNKMDYDLSLILSKDMSISYDGGL